MNCWHRLFKPTRQVTILSPVPSNNTTKDCDAAVLGALPLSARPQMPYPGSLLQHPTADSSMWDNAPASCPALSPYPVSTLPLPPVLKPHQTYGYRRGAPPINVSPPALDPLYPPFSGQAGTDKLFSLARQYGACVDRCANSEPKHTNQELSTKRRNNPVRKAVSATVLISNYCSGLCLHDQGVLTTTLFAFDSICSQYLSTLLWPLSPNSCKLSVH